MLWNWQRPCGLTAQDFKHHVSQADTDQTHELTDRDVFGRATALHMYLTEVRRRVERLNSVEMGVLKGFQQGRESVPIDANLLAGERDQL